MPRAHLRAALAVVITALAALLLSSGIAVSTASAAVTPQTHPSASHGHTPVGICHATSSDSHPYQWIVVDDDSAKYQGHLAHRNDPNKHWQNAGTWNGISHTAGAAKRDYIEGLDQGVTRAWCLAAPSASPSPSESATPTETESESATPTPSESTDSPTPTPTESGTTTELPTPTPTDSESTVPATSTPSYSELGGGTLPKTGGDINWMLLAFAGWLIAAGVVFYLLSVSPRSGRHES